MYQLDANNFTMIFSHKWTLHVSDIYMSIFRSSYMLFHCRMWCYAIGVEAVVLRSWCVVWCTVCQYPTYLHYGTSKRRDHKPDDTVSYFRRPESTETLGCEPHSDITYTTVFRVRTIHSIETAVSEYAVTKYNRCCMRMYVLKTLLTYCDRIFLF